MQKQEWEVANLENQVERLIAAVNWACGVGEGGFDDYANYKTGAQKPRFWWRPELAKRAGLIWDREKLCWISAPPEPPPDLLREAVEALKEIKLRAEDDDAPWWMDCPDKGGIDVERINDILSRYTATEPEKEERELCVCGHPRRSHGYKETDGIGMCHILTQGGDDDTTACSCSRFHTASISKE